MSSGSVPASSVPAMGFNGIAGDVPRRPEPDRDDLSPSFFIQHITAGGAYVDKSIYCSQVSDLISSLIIYLCAFVLVPEDGDEPLDFPA